MAQAWRYWRIVVPDDNGGGGITMNEIEFRVGGVDQTSGGTAFGSSRWNAGEIANAFSNTGSTCNFTSFAGYGPGGSEYLGYDFGSGNDKAITEATWNNNGASPANARSPAQCIVQCSLNGVTYVTAYTSGALSWGSNETKTFSFTPPDVPGKFGRQMLTPDFREGA